MDTEATKAYFKGHATGSRYLHLATHGYLDAASPMYSGLLFSDGMLQTYEIFNMAIDAELVTLSACQTGLGRLKGGEGLVGISRAFLFAGSPSVIASLWSVADQATAPFMTEFYRNLNRGMSKAEALREAKRWMLTRAEHPEPGGKGGPYDHPFFWAPFILIGESR
jgi:CHAT domain-containing protein